MDDQALDDFAPRWTGCAGTFNAGTGVDSRQNEEVHYRKHVVLGREWGQGLSIGDYRSMATQHLDSLDSDDIIELCQADDVAVVKFNLKTGDLGLARRDTGTIKTFFRPNDVHYVLRKVQSGSWGSPDIVDGFDLSPSLPSLSQDPEQNYLFQRLEALSLEVAAQSHDVIADFLEPTPLALNIFLLIAKISECRFLAFELRRRVLTSEQEDAVFVLRKRVAIGTASLEALERHRAPQLIAAVQDGIDTGAQDQYELWRTAPDLIIDSELFEHALDERQTLGFILMELRVLQFGGRLRELQLDTCEQRLRRSDIYLRRYFYVLAKRFGYQPSLVVVPEDFFWQKMAQVPIVQVDAE